MPVQAASSGSYWQYLHYANGLSKLGFLLCFLKWTPARTFVIGYGLVASYFSLKMVRLLIICGPIASICTGIALGTLLDLCLAQIVELPWSLLTDAEDGEDGDKKEGDKTKEGPGSPVTPTSESKKKKKKDDDEPKAEEKKKGAQKVVPPQSLCPASRGFESRSGGAACARASAWQPRG